jgi:ADP-ribose pyrophosphatase YjhB (NUDIX family)
MRLLWPSVGELDGWISCPRCRAELSGDTARLECAACGFVAYANPKPTATAVCVDDAGRVLLTRRAVEPWIGSWDLPGGFVDEDEHPLDALRRELREETGLEVEPLEFLGVWMDRYGGDSTASSTLNMFWRTRVVGGEPHPADDVAELRWFAPEELPDPPDFAFDCVPRVLAAWRLRDEHA